jgi:hypothetical protein
MNSFQSWLSIAANIGIVAGLVLVAFQINQESEIAGTTIQSELLGNSIDYYETIVGEDAAESLAKAIYDPPSLSERDKVVLFNLYLGEFVKTYRQEVLLEPDEPPSNATVFRWTDGLLVNDYARAWWEAMREPLTSRLIPRYQQAIDAFISQPENEVLLHIEFFDSIDALMAQAAAQRDGSQ